MVHGAAQVDRQISRVRTPTLPSTSVNTSKPASDRISLFFDFFRIQDTSGAPI
jgi:hypothetical protein